MAAEPSRPGARAFFAKADEFAVMWIDRLWTAEARARSVVRDEPRDRPREG